jgi:hypothetical protein
MGRVLLPPPLDVPWLRKPLSSARTEVSELPDGRTKLWIQHETLRGVTPAMLAWWFAHLEGDMEAGGRRVPRYRRWHPLDHIAFRYARRGADGAIGPGAVFHIQEAFGRDPACLVDVHTRVEKLDQTGFIHGPLRLGRKVAHMEYVFEEVPGGTRYTNWLIAGPALPLGRLLNPLLRRMQFSSAMGTAWLTHNVEEVGNFESFLPDLYRREAIAGPAGSALPLRPAAGPRPPS